MALGDFGEESFTPSCDRRGASAWLAWLRSFSLRPRPSGGNAHVTQADCGCVKDKAKYMLVRCVDRQDAAFTAKQIRCVPLNG